MVKIANNLRVRFDYLVQKTAEDGTVALTVIRDGKTRVVQLPVSPDRRMLIPDLKGAYPSYFILGPIVFSTVTVQMLSSINQASVMGLAFVGNPGITRRGDAPAFEGEQLVVIAAPLFPHKLSQGYPVPIGWAVKSINGTMIKNLRHLVEVLRDAQSDFVTVEFYGRDIETFAFPRKETLAATSWRIMISGPRDPLMFSRFGMHVQPSKRRSLPHCRGNGGIRTEEQRSLSLSACFAARRSVRSAMRISDESFGHPPTCGGTNTSARRSVETISDSSEQSCSVFCEAPANGGEFSDAPFVWVSAS
jgi:hypothetical protein